MCIDLHSGDGCEEGDSRAGGGARPEGGIACENGSWSGGGSDHGTELEACSRVASDNDRVAACLADSIGNRTSIDGSDCNSREGGENGGALHAS